MTTRNRAQVASSYTIVKGAMLQETYTACMLWDSTVEKRANLACIRQNPAMPVKSSNWLKDICCALGRRFDFSGPDQVLVFLAQKGHSFEEWKMIVFWHMTRDEFLVRDFCTNWLYQQHRDGALRLKTEDVFPYLKALGLSGRYTETWTKQTMARVAVGLLRIATDFGLLRGSIVREFTSFHLPDNCFLYVLHAIAESTPNARAIIEASDWRLFLMDAEDVERQILRLHQFRKLHYEVAGSIAQLTLPCTSALDYARKMAA